MEIQAKMVDEELNLIDVYKFIRKNIYTFFICALLGSAVGLVGSYIIPAEWEATSLIRVGQSGLAGGGSKYIEPPIQLVESLKNQSFQNDVLNALEITLSDENNVAKNFRESLKVKLEKSDLLSLSVRGDTSAEAKRYMNAVIYKVKNTHKEKLALFMIRKQVELELITKDLQIVEADIKRLNDALNKLNVDIIKNSFSQFVLLSNVIALRYKEREKLTERKIAIDDTLSVDNTYATKEIGRIEVSEKPVYPKKSIFTLVGLLFGLIFGFLFSIYGNFKPKLY